MSRRYALGLDFGTLSARAVLVDVESGREMAEAVARYEHGVMEKSLPDGAILPSGFALAHPRDYLDCLVEAVRGVLRAADAKGSAVVGIGLDATSSTVLPVRADGTPLCFSEDFASRPHAYMKLWKHHGAYPQARRMEQVARERGEDWLAYCGGSVLCELMLPKALETAQADTAVWRACDAYIELADWLVWQLTGRCARSQCIAGSNSLYRPGIGYPDDAFFRAVAPDLEPVTGKLAGPMLALGQVAGRLTPSMAGRLGLEPGTPVGAPLIDSHAAVTGCGANRAGDLTAVLGTSACYLLNARDERGIPGICSVAYETLSPGLYGYEGGQSSFGDGLDWFIRNCVPAMLTDEASRREMDIHAVLAEKAATLRPGQTGLLMLDWLNGVRSPLMRPELTGVVTGLTLDTTAEGLYRAMAESVCFGARRILAQYERRGLRIRRVFAAGGIPRKNPFLMQLMADICRREVRVCNSAQASALGSAIIGAAASGLCGDVGACTARMAAASDTVYKPAEEPAYDDLYARYLALSERVLA